MNELHPPIVKKNPYIPAIASVFIWGLGQILNKQLVKGLFFFAFEALLVIIEIVTGNYSDTSKGFSARTNGGFFIKGLWGIITLGEVTRKMSIKGLSEGDHSIVLMINGILAVIFLLIFVAIWIWNIRDAYQTCVQFNLTGKFEGAKQYIRQLWDTMFEYIILTPSIIIIILISVMPIIFGALLAFTNYNKNHLPPTKLVDWVGFSNFVDLFNLPIWSSTFTGVFTWTIVWAVASTVTCAMAGLLQAVILQSSRVKFKKFWRTIYILPWAVPSIISLMVYRTLFNGQFGPISQFLVDMGITSERVSWFTDANNPNLARFIIILVNLWIGFPVSMALMTGIMTSIDKEIYEAAKIDGASKAQEFWKLTFPLVLSATLPLLIMQFAGNFNNFGVIYFLTEGGPNNPNYQFAGSTDILITWIYKLTVDQRMYNMASIMSILIFIVIGSVSAWNFSRTKAFKEDM